MTNNFEISEYYELREHCLWVAARVDMLELDGLDEPQRKQALTLLKGQMDDLGFHLNRAMIRLTATN